jgi:hypothetical protein
VGALCATGSASQKSRAIILIQINDLIKADIHTVSAFSLFEVDVNPFDLAIEAL